MELNSKQRKFLEKEAHSLSPVVIIGAAGLTEGVLNMIKTSVSVHELVKVKFNDFKDEKKELSEKIVLDCEVFLVCLIGNVAVFYKQAEKNSKYSEKLKKIK